MRALSSTSSSRQSLDDCSQPNAVGDVSMRWPPVVSNSAVTFSGTQSVYRRSILSGIHAAERIELDLIVVFPFAEQPGFLEGDLLVGRVLRVLHSRQIDLVLPEFLVHKVNCIVELGSF